MKKFQSLILLLVACLCMPISADAWDLSRILSATIKTVQATTISDSQIREYVGQYIQYLDKQSKVAPESSPYTIRLRKLTSGVTNVDGVPLNFKVYLTQEVNAFACADGSVRVYSGLMDIMTDDEVLGVIGHEIGHVAHKDTKKAFKQALLTSALLDGLGSASETVAMLTDSQLGQLGQELLSAKYSRSQESNADTYGYDFLRKQGKNPLYMASAFKKLQSAESGSGASNALLQMFSSHPSTQKRIKDIEKRAKKDNISAPPGYTY